MDMSRWPDLAVLELLVAVSEHGSLGAAARAVEIAQPNASRSIARFEHSLGLSLLERRPRGSRLTAEGEIVVDWARGVLDSARELAAATDALRAGQSAQLDIAASMTVAEYLVPAWLAELRRNRPELDVALRVQNSTEVFDLVAAGSCDLGFVESPRVRPGLGRVTVACDRLVVVVAPDHPWATRERAVTVGDLAATALVVREPGSGTRTTLDEALREFTPVPPTLELSSNAAVRVSVTAGAGPAVLSELAVRPWLDAGDLVEILVEGLDLSRTMHAVWNASAPPTGAAAELIEIARRVGASASARARP